MIDNDQYLLLYTNGTGFRPGKSCKRCKRRLRTFCRKSRYFEDILVENPAFLTEDGGRSLKDGKLRIDQGELRLYDGELRIENSEMRLKGCGLRIDNQNLRILPCYPHI